MVKKEEIITKRTAYIDRCPICKKEVRAFSLSNLEYNMKLHKETHEKEEDEDEATKR